MGDNSHGSVSGDWFPGLEHLVWTLILLTRCPGDHFLQHIYTRELRDWRELTGWPSEAAAVPRDMSHTRFWSCVRVQRLENYTCMEHTYYASWPCKYCSSYVYDCIYGHTHDMGRHEESWHAEWYFSWSLNGNLDEDGKYSSTIN